MRLFALTEWKKGHFFYKYNKENLVSWLFSAKKQLNVGQEDSG